MSRHSTEYSFNQNEQIEVMAIIQNSLTMNQSTQTNQEIDFSEQLETANSFLQQTLASIERLSSEIPIRHRNLHRQSENSNHNLMRMDTERELKQLERRHQIILLQVERNSSNSDIIQNQHTQALTHSIQSGSNQSELEQQYKNKLIQRQAFYKKQLAQKEAYYQRKLFQAQQKIFEKNEEIKFQKLLFEKTMQFQRKMAQSTKNNLNERIANRQAQLHQRVKENFQVRTKLAEREIFFKRKEEVQKQRALEIERNHQRETKRLNELVDKANQRIEKLEKIIVQADEKRKQLQLSRNL